MAPSQHDWKIVDWDVKPQHNQPTNSLEVICKVDYMTSAKRSHRIYQRTSMIKACIFPKSLTEDRVKF